MFGIKKSTACPAAVPIPTGEAGALVVELIGIAEADGFLDWDGRYLRTRQIGKALNRLGGMRQMRAVHHVVFQRHRLAAHELTFAWDGIGDWQG